MTVRFALQGAVPRRPAAVRRALRGAGVGSWIYLGTDAAWRMRSERGVLAEIDPVVVAPSLAAAAERLRQPFLDAIGELSQLNREIEWWASELAAKNPYYGLFNRLCALAALPDALSGSKGTLVVCETPAMLDEAIDLTREAGLEVAVIWGGSPYRRKAERAGRALAGRSLAALAHRRRRRALANLGAQAERELSGDGTTLLVTWADRRNIAADGSYVDPHFGPLAEQLRARGQRVAYLPRILPGADFQETARGLLGTGEEMVFPELYVDNPSWRGCRRRAAAFEPRIPDQAAVDGIPLARLAREDVGRTESARAEALAYEPLVRGLARAGIAPGRVIFPFEGHAWEQALTWSVKRHMAGTEVIGYDNVNFSRLALSLYPARSEIGIRPLPDRVVTNGPAFQRILVREGFPERSIRTGCALRHDYLWRTKPEVDAAHGAAKTRVLVATSIDLAPSVEQIEKAVAAFGGDERFELVIKCHPAVDAGAVRRWARGVEGCANARFVETPIGELLRASDLMLYTYSVVCYEALAHGVPPVLVRSDTTVDLDQLEPFPEVRWEGRTPEELRRVAEEVAALEELERDAWRERAAGIVEEALAPPGDDCAAAFLD